MHDYTSCCLHTVDPPDDEQQACSKHLEACYWNKLTLRLLMSHTHTHTYIYIYMCVCVCVCVCVCMEHPFLMFLDHTQRRTTVGWIPLDE